MQCNGLKKTEPSVVCDVVVYWYLVYLDEDKFILMIIDKVGNGALPGVEHLGN